MSTIHGNSEFGPAAARRQPYSPLEAYWNAFREWRKRERLRAALDDLSDRELMDNRADFRYPIARQPTAGRLDVDHDVILLGVEAVIDPADFRTDAGVPELSQPRELIAADNVAFGLDFHEGDGAVLLQHEIRESVAHLAEVLA